MDDGRWTMDDGRWTMDDGRWTMDDGGGLLVEDEIAVSLRGAVPLAHVILRAWLKPGDRVLDATCGNGRDTLLLARLVGPAGKVWAFDIQEEALAATRSLLDTAGYLPRVELVAAGHERLAEFLSVPLNAAVFNLGYLPGGDKKLITLPVQTLVALAAALELLVPGGLITVALYSGHPGGREECLAVETWAAGLGSLSFNVWRSFPLNRSPESPYLLLVEKRGLKS